MDMNNNVILWGTGKIGKRYYSLMCRLGLKPRFFIDNDKEKQGTCIDGIMVCSPDVLKATDDYVLFIACKYNREVYNQAVSIGVSKDKIYSAHQALFHLCKCGIDNDIWNLQERNVANINREKVAFDLQNGYAMGGIETWSIEQGEKLSNAGKKVTFISGNSDNEQLSIPEYASNYNVLRKDDINDIIVDNTCYLKREGFGTVISNFAGINMMTNCYYKKLNNNVRNIMVIHNDEEFYYTAAIELEEYIDYCLVVSLKIKNKLIDMGVSKEKIVKLDWNIKPQNEGKITTDKGALRIGYAGRITTVAKRLDYIPLIVSALEERNIDYIFELAGIGDYYDELSEYIEKNNLKCKVRLLGMIDKKDMKIFWDRQDVYLSCSDWEGHSISQGEGIASGAVPVVTDVSGARDDIVDGVTGFIVPIGDWEKLSEKICFLSHNRDVLRKMSKASLNMALERSKTYNDNLLEELCL